MARQARAVSSKGLYYVELKGDTLFMSQEQRDTFLKIAAECFSGGGKIYGVSLFDDSARMVVKENPAGISANVKSLKIKYARYFNKVTARTGKLFSDRFKSAPYESVKEAEDAAKKLDSDIEAPKPAASKKPKLKTPAKTTEKLTDKPVKKQSNKNLPSWLL